MRPGRVVDTWIGRRETASLAVHAPMHQHGGQDVHWQVDWQRTEVSSWHELQGGHVTALAWVSPVTGLTPHKPFIHRTLQSVQGGGWQAGPISICKLLHDAQLRLVALGRESV